MGLTRTEIEAILCCCGLERLREGQNSGTESAFRGSVPRLEPAVHSRFERFVCNTRFCLQNMLHAASI